MAARNSKQNSSRRGSQVINLDLQTQTHRNKKTTFKGADAAADAMLNLIEETNSVSGYVSQDSKNTYARAGYDRRMGGIKSAAQHKSSLNVSPSRLGVDKRDSLTGS